MIKLTYVKSTSYRLRTVKLLYHKGDFKAQSLNLKDKMQENALSPIVTKLKIKL